jgi:bifunctional UDP-N-acetylglucosamine pyrophosphorylase/glucosamine-1-phosphate N-acetyltransferase
MRKTDSTTKRTQRRTHKPQSRPNYRRRPLTQTRVPLPKESSVKGTAAIILSAGLGTRMKSSLPKAVIPLSGRPLSRYCIDAARSAGIERIIVVVGHQHELAREALGADVEYALQTKQMGTGHAALSTRSSLARFGGTVIVMPGDAPLISPTTLRRLVETHQSTGDAATVATSSLDDPTGYGRIIRSPDGRIIAVVEETDCSALELANREINTGFYAFDCEVLFRALAQVLPANKQGEYYLTDTVKIIAGQGLRIGAFSIEDPLEVLGINSPVELCRASQALRERKLSDAMRSGVRIADPNTTYIDFSVALAADCDILPFTIIEGASKISAGCSVGPFARLRDAELADGASVAASFVSETKLGKNAKVGPFAHLRNGVELSDEAEIGNFVEVKKSQIGAGSKAKHLTYIGDAFVGKNANIGAGTITCNYDGRTKNTTYVEDSAFVGSNVTLIAPVKVAEGAYVAAGSTINKDVPKDALGIGRAKQENKEGWAARRRQQAQPAKTEPERKARRPARRRSSRARRGRTPKS